MDLSIFEICLFIVGGFAAGIINTLAGNGSAITLTLLISTGMDASAANATNRIGVLFQTVTGVFSLKKTKRTKKHIRDSVWFVIPSTLGSVIGASLALGTPPKTLKIIIGLLMVGILINVLFNAKKWLINTDPGVKMKSKKNMIWFFAVGLYAGFIQMGFGIITLSILVLIVKYSLKDANIIKIVAAAIATIPAFFIFWYSGLMDWFPGVMLAIGSSIGAWFGTRFVLTHPKANEYIRYLLIAVIIFGIYRIFYPIIMESLV